MTTLLNRGLFALLLIFTFGVANATYMGCSSTLAGLVSGATDCEISDATQDFLNTNPMTVNSDGGFFAIDDWSFIGKDEGPGGNGLGRSGEWALANDIWSLFDNIMLVFKSGNGTSLVGYLLDGQTTSGDWISPFRSPDFALGTRVKDVSHISFYGTSYTSVPEPGALIIMSLGLIGIAGARIGKGKV